jgi:hypothetical protein
MNRKKVYRHEICVTRRDTRVHGGSERKVKKESQTCNSSTVLKFIHMAEKSFKIQIHFF